MEKSINWENGFENKLKLTEKDYNSILETINDPKNNEKIKIIPIEVIRTSSKEGNQNEILKNDLEEVLKVFVLSNGDLGYYSGMSFIARIIMKITNNNKVKTFIILRNIFENKNLKKIYLNKDIDNIINNFKIKFKENIPKLYEHFEKNNIQPITIIKCWITPLFCFYFDNNIGEYVLKLFISSGNFDILIDAVLSVLMTLENNLLNKEYKEIYIVLSSIYISIDYNKFVENMKKLNH